MALSAGSAATWSDVSNIYNRVISERGRWGRSTGVTAGAQGATISYQHGRTLRDAMVDLSNNVSFLTGFASSVNGTGNINAGDKISVGTLTTLRNVLNGMRTTFGYSGNVGVSYGTYGTGFSANSRHCSYRHSDSNVFGFTSGGDFGHSADYGFWNNTVFDVNNYCAFCASGFFPGCSPFCTGGFCTSYFSPTI